VTLVADEDEGVAALKGMRCAGAIRLRRAQLPAREVDAWTREHDVARDE
jgi:hypothetical protein